MLSKAIKHANWTLTNEYTPFYHVKKSTSKIVVQLLYPQRTLGGFDKVYRLQRPTYTDNGPPKVITSLPRPLLWFFFSTPYLGQHFWCGRKEEKKIILQPSFSTSQELWMPSSVTLNCQVTMISKIIQGVFFHWYFPPPKYRKVNLGG